MAAPTFVQAGAGVVRTTGTGTVSLAGTTAGNLIVLQFLNDGSAGDTTVGSISGIEALDGTDSAMTDLLGALINDTGDTIEQVSIGAGAALQGLLFGRSISGGTVSLSLTTGTNDDYTRLYEFSGVHSGTTLSDILENGSAGTVNNDSGASNTIADVGVTTLGADRLACNFVAVNDDNLLDAFTGETGGDWAEATAEYAESTGTDGSIGLQIATIASAGTINGGTDTMAASDAWGVVGFALIGTTAAGPAASLVIPHHGYPTAPTRYRL